MAAEVPNADPDPKDGVEVAPKAGLAAPNAPKEVVDPNAGTAADDPKVEEAPKADDDAAGAPNAEGVAGVVVPKADVVGVEVAPKADVLPKDGAAVEAPKADVDGVDEASKLPKAEPEAGVELPKTEVDGAAVVANGEGTPNDVDPKVGAEVVEDPNAEGAVVVEAPKVDGAAGVGFPKVDAEPKPPPNVDVEILPNVEAGALPNVDDEPNVEGVEDGRDPPKGLAVGADEGADPNPRLPSPPNVLVGSACIAESSILFSEVSSLSISSTIVSEFEVVGVENVKAGAVEDANENVD